MICTNCSKLLAITAQRFCNKCKAKIFNNLDVLCDNCSNQDSCCARCLKKISTSTSRSGCRVCGGKK